MTSLGGLRPNLGQPILGEILMKSTLDVLANMSSTPDNQVSLIEGDPWQGIYPGLFEFLVLTSHRGKPRQPGKLAIACEAHKASIRLTDVENGKICFYVSKNIALAFEGAEKAYQDGSLDWRDDQYAGKKR